ncbi:MAG: hypothetical protein Q8O63_14565 [Hoeflea sp.]|nr:hypothetical protein [Hoeflea sp.]
MAGFEAQIGHQHSDWRGDQEIVDFLVPEWMTVQKFMLERGMQRDRRDQHKDTQYVRHVSPSKHQQQPHSIANACQKQGPPLRVIPHCGYTF